MAGTLPPRLAIFDFDGTLADSAGWFYRNLNEAARRHGFRETTPSEREMLRDRTTREIVAYLGVPRWKLPLIARSMRRAVSRDIDQIRLFPWAPAVLRELSSRGIALAVVSSNAKSNIVKVMGADLAACIEVYATGASLFGKAKLIKSVLHRCRCPAILAVAIGDEVRDIEAARRASVASMAVTWGYASATALEAAAPTHLVHRPEELLARFS